MYDSILRYVAGADSLFILGPGEAKKEFQKHIATSGKTKHVVDIESSDKMTSPQLVAKIREHFHLSLARHKIISGEIRQSLNPCDQCYRVERCPIRRTGLVGAGWQPV